MEEPAPARIELPGRLDRSGRLGPFPSGGAALKFLLLGAIGALIALRFGPLFWTPFLAGGFLLAVHRRDGRALDEVGLDYVRFRLRRTAGRSAGRLRRSNAVSGVGRTPAGRVAAGLEAGGVPVAFLPPLEASRLFDQYRALLRSNPSSLVLRVGRVPLRADPFLPRGGPAASAGEAAARDGYAELIELIAQRRCRRRVRLLAVGGHEGSAGTRLESGLRAISASLEAMGVPHGRLHGDRLAAVAPGLRADQRPGGEQ
jgi:hypothetical protein